jgi:hypothetical protein
MLLLSFIFCRKKDTDRLLYESRAEALEASDPLDPLVGTGGGWGGAADGEKGGGGVPSGTMPDPLWGTPVLWLDRGAADGDGTTGGAVEGKGLLWTGGGGPDALVVGAPWCMDVNINGATALPAFPLISKSTVSTKGMGPNVNCNTSPAVFPYNMI